jgi:hypothetical protein
VLGFTDKRKISMTLPKTGCPQLTNKEKNELDSLKAAIEKNPASVHYEEMERFADLMVRSLGECQLEE